MTMPFDGKLNEIGNSADGQVGYVSQHLIPIPAARVCLHRDAEHSVGMLDRLLELFANGQRWTQGMDHTPDDRFCIVGALSYLRSVHGEDDQAAMYLALALHDLYGPWHQIIDVNDGPGTTFQTIRTLIKHARRRALGDASCSFRLRYHTGRSWHASVRHTAAEMVS
jgi:hypothetical protein